MFNFKASSGVAGKVFKKLNHMDKKQAYTYGAIGVVCLVALLTLASVAGGGADDSLDNLNARGYDLAQMPFLNDEAENYLLASKYPDMKNNNVSALYSPRDKKDRQEEDAKEAAESGAADTSADTSGSYNSSSYGSGYTGRGGGGRGTPTQIGSFSSSGSMASASGGNTSATYGGTMRGDFSPFQRESRGNEAPFKPQNAKQALTRFNAASRAAARGVNKAVDSRKALLGSQVEGGFGTDSNGVPLGESKGINYDEAESADLSGLDDTMAEKAQEARDKKEAEKLAEEKGFWEQFMNKLVDGALNIGMQWAGSKIDQIDARATAMRTTKAQANGAYDNWKNSTGDAKAKYAENFEKNFGMSPDTYGKWSSSTNKADKKSLKNVFKGSSSYNAALSNDTGSMLGKAISNSTKGDSSGKSWAEYQACVQNKGGNCNRYKPD